MIVINPKIDTWYVMVICPLGLELHFMKRRVGAFHQLMWSQQWTQPSPERNVVQTLQNSMFAWDSPHGWMAFGANLLKKNPPFRWNSRFTTWIYQVLPKTVSIMGWPIYWCPFIQGCSIPLLDSQDLPGASWSHPPATIISTCFLMVGPPLWKIWKSIGMMRFPIYGKIKNVPTHQPVHVFWFLYLLVNAPIHQPLTNRIHTASRCSLKPRPMLPMLAQATYSNLFPEVFPSSNPQFGGFKPNKNLRENPRVCPIIIVTINTPKKPHGM